MSQVNETIEVSFPIASVITAIRRSAKTFGSLVENKNSFSIKENVQRTSWSTSWPATVTAELTSKGEKTVISFNASNFGFGPIQSNECKSRLGAVKSTILSELDDIKNNQNANPISSADEILKYKSLLDAKIITEEEFNAKKKQLLGL